MKKNGLIVRLIFVTALFLGLVACDQKSKTEKAVESISVDIEVVRFDKLFFETPPEGLSKLKKQFPFFFPTDNDDEIWIEKMKNPLWRELYSEVQKKFPNFDSEKEELKTLFKHIKYHFPKFKTPKVITVISEMDYNNKVIYADSLLIISLELYLGKDHKFYQFPAYLRQNFEKKQILPDVVTSFGLQQDILAPGPTLLDQMLFEGKQLYLKDLLISDYADDEKIGYTKAQIQWVQENESYIWRYFIEKEMLYSNDTKLANRFINPAPFSKFYLEIDNDSPGRVGAWIGWQIVRSFVKNNEISIDKLLKMNAKELFEKSKYKPKKP